MTKRLSGVALAAAAAIGTALASAPTALALDYWATNDRIAYASCPSPGNCDITSSLSDGDDELPYFDTDDFEDSPTLSDNGKLLAFRSGSDIWTIKANGSGLDNITESVMVDEGEPEISPDGKSILFTRYAGPGLNFDVVRARIDGTGQKTILDSDVGERAASWSPDGKRIVFERQKGNSSDIYSVKQNGKDKRKITDNNRREYTPAYSPNGKRVVLVQQVDDFTTRLVTVKTNGKSLEEVQASLTNPSAPSWSPNGKRIAFFGTASEQSDVFTVKPDGTGERNVTDDAAPDYFID
jgi:TolB protein